MRVIAGEYGGRVLRAPKGDATRPTTDRVRESMMSMIHSALGFEDVCVLDAFAGSGSLGIEALSRGAQMVCFFERAPQAYQTIQKNLATLGIDGRRARVQKADVLSSHQGLYGTFDLVFLDPPYAYDAATIIGFLTELHHNDNLAHDVVCVYEHDAKDDQSVDNSLASSPFKLLKRKKFGDTMVDLICIKDGEER
ncbi:16S rRNA (guanine(966)-N(2))-methyltransferase RsmD [Eggerthellaceae bacterium 3-80]|nr:16S rRNA (guanine(966)-N(2))-methyltransferase RsmD [bacterium D16-34]